MKKFFIKIINFILPFIVLAYPLDYGISHFLKNSNQYEGELEVWSKIYNSEANYDVAIYGSSRAWVHIDPKIISDSLNLSSYNFGIDGHNFWLQYLRHIELLKFNKKPKIIIFSIDIFSLQKRIDLYQQDQFLPFMLWNKRIIKYTSAYKGFNNFDYYIPLLRYAGRIKSLNASLQALWMRSKLIKYRNDGFLGMDKEWNDDLEKAKSNKKSYYINFDSHSIELFNRFIIECKRHDIELILVYTPEYIEGQKFVTNRNEVIEFYEKISKKYDLIFYNYSNDPICLNKNLFYNASHLNKTGAEFFTKKFAGILKTQLHNKIKLQ